MGIREVLRNFAEQIGLVNPSSRGSQNQGGQSGRRRPTRTTPVRQVGASREDRGAIAPISTGIPGAHAILLSDVFDRSIGNNVNNNLVYGPSTFNSDNFNDTNAFRQLQPDWQSDNWWSPSKKSDDEEKDEATSQGAGEDNVTGERPPMALSPGFAKGNGTGPLRQVGASREDKGSVAPLSTGIPGSHAILFSDIFDRGIGNVNNNLVNGPSALNGSNFNNTNPYRQLQPNWQTMGYGNSGGGAGGGGGAFGAGGVGVSGNAGGGRGGGGGALDRGNVEPPHPLNQVGASREDKGSVAPLSTGIPGAHAILFSDIFDQSIGKTNDNLVNGPSAINSNNFNNTNPFRQLQPGWQTTDIGNDEGEAGGESGTSNNTGGSGNGGTNTGESGNGDVGTRESGNGNPGNSLAQGNNPSYIDQVRRASSGDTPSGIPDASLPNDGSADGTNHSGGAVVGEDDEDRGPTADGTTSVGDEKRDQGPLNDAEVAAMEQEFIDETLGGKYENWQDFQFNGTYDEWKQAADELASLAWIYDQYGEEGFDQYWEDATGFDPYLYQLNAPMDEDQYQLYQNFMGTVDQDWEAMAQWLIDNGYRQYIVDTANPTEDAVNWLKDAYTNGLIQEDDYGTYRDAEGGYTADMLLNDLLLQDLYGAAYNQRSTGLSEADINNIMGYMDVDTRFTTDPDNLTEDQAAQGSVYRSLPSDYNVMLPSFQQVYNMQEDPYRFTGTLLNMNNPDYLWYLEGDQQ